MSPTAAAPAAQARPPWHPLAVACASMIAARAVALTLYFMSNDPNGHQLYATPANALIIALPYHGALLLTVAAVLFTMWKLIVPARVLITALGVAVALFTIVVGQVDLAMQWFVGLRFAPMVANTYIGDQLLSSDLYAPLLFHPVYTATALALMAAASFPILRSVVLARRGTLFRMPGWAAVAGLIAVAFLCRYPIRWAYGHQRDVMRPPELVFAYHWIYPSATPTLTDEARAVAQLRAFIDPGGRSHWLDPQFPVVRVAPAARNRFRAAATTSQAPDVIVFTIESLRGADVGYVPGNYPPGASPTPRLDALARGGVVFSRFISNGNPTPRGFFAINSGVLDHRDSFNTSGATGSEFDALPARLRRAGYFTLALWGANPSFDNQLFWANKWYDRLLFPPSAARFVILRPTADDVLMDHLIAEIAAHDLAKPAQAIFAYVAPGGTHEPYTVEGDTRLPDSVVRAIAAERDPRTRARKVLANVDAQIGRVLDFLATRRSRRPLLVIVTGDHAEVAGERVPQELRGLPHNGVEYTAALIAGPPALVGSVPRVESFTASQVDLTPTILDLIGDREPTNSMGTNLFADVPVGERFAVSISGQGYRLDRGDWSLYVRRTDPGTVYTQPAFAPTDSLRVGLSGSPFTPDDARLLWENMNTWSYLIEHDRVWRSALFGRVTGQAK